MRFLMCLFLLAACPHSAPPPCGPRCKDPRGTELTLGVGDVVSINVWGQENKELNTEPKIRPDGTITMPLVGDIKAAGLTPTQLKDKITQELGKYLKLSAGTPVTVAVKAWNSYRFTMAGEFTKPGVLTSDQFVRLSQAITMAGGVTRFAKRDDCRVLRYDPVKKVTDHIQFDYDELFKNEDMDFFILAGDEIYCP